jgi:hypothetical protein
MPSIYSEFGAGFHAKKNVSFCYFQKMKQNGLDFRVNPESKLEIRGMCNSDPIRLLIG